MQFNEIKIKSILILCQSVACHRGACGQNVIYCQVLKSSKELNSIWVTNANKMKPENTEIVKVNVNWLNP
jgi:hypothetical protein